MKVIKAVVIIVALCFTSCSDDIKPATDIETPTVEIADCEPGQVIVKFALEMSDILDNLTPQTASAQVATRLNLPSTDQVLDILGAYRLERVFPIDPRSEEQARASGLHLWYIVYFDHECLTVAEAVQQLSRLGEVQRSIPNRHIYPSYNRSKRPVVIGGDDINGLNNLNSLNNIKALNKIAADPLLPFQWHYINDGTSAFATAQAPVLAGSDVNCAEAWDICTGDSSIIVAVMDEGVMWNHPDLAANMWHNPGETMGSDIDADGNGYAGDEYGYNFVRNSGFISCYSVYDTGHGTHVAGTISAVNNNGIGVCGIAGGDPSNPGVRIMSLQIFDDNSVATLVSEARAMKYAADNGALIIQCSWGYNSHLSNPLDGYTPGPETEKEWATLYPLEKEALDYFTTHAGSPNGVLDGGLAIFASGNEYAGSSAFPGAYSKCISVSAIAADYTPACYSNYGTAVDLCAPGGDEEYYAPVGDDADPYDHSYAQSMVLSTLCVDGAPSYGYFEGTSMACPHVSGVAALGLSYAAKMRRHFTREEFTNLLVSTARDIDGILAERGEKIYHRFHSAWGSPAITMNLNNYCGKMGRLVDAGKLLRAIESAGSDMVLPNIYLAVGCSQTLDLARFYLNGENLTYTVSIGSPSVATASLQGTLLTLNGLAEGIARLTVTTSTGNTQTVTITVRQGANPHGWL